MPGDAAGYRLRMLASRQALRPLLKRYWIEVLRHSRVRTRMLANVERMVPGFLIAGGQRCGTTSLFRYLARHPAVLPSLVKEVHYFDHSYHRGPGWYLSHFPRRAAADAVSARLGFPAVSGEASPFYTFHPYAPERIRRTLPGVKIILILRDPTARAYSHFNYERQHNIEPCRSFEQALDLEEERLHGEAERLRDERYISFNSIHYSYVSRGLYIHQVRRWLDLFPAGDLLILKHEELFADPRRSLAEVFSFLGISSFPALAGARLRQHNRAPAEQGLRPDTERRLRELFAPFNDELTDLLRRDFRWA